jgi:uncharacterized protein (TIGR02270 family)
MASEGTAAESSASEVEPLWDVVEEHLSEAEFCYIEFERALDHPMLTLSGLARAMEARLTAHIDGLVIGGAAVAERLLVPAIADASEMDSGRVTSAIVALLKGPRARTIGAGLFHPKKFIRDASVRGCSLAPSSRLEAWAIDRFRENKEPSPRAALLPIVGGLLEPEVLLECLQSEHDELCAAAARVVSRGERRTFGSVIEHLIKHRDPSVRESALIASLTWGLPNAWGVCERRALDREIDEPLITQLYGALGGNAAHARLSKLLENPKRRLSALAALGYAGNPKHVPELIAAIASADPIEAKVAAQSVALITGLDLNDDAYAVPAAVGGGTLAESVPDPTEAEGLPALEDDNLEANLIPPPQAALPQPDPSAFAKYWDKVGPSFQNQTRCLAGKAGNTPDALLDFLDIGALGPRNILALVLGIRSGGQAWFDPRQTTSRQRERLAALRTLDLRSFARFFDR